MNPRGTAAHFTSCILAGLAMIPACALPMILILSTPPAETTTVKSWIRFLLVGALPLLIATTYIHYLRVLTRKSLALSLACSLIMLITGMVLMWPAQPAN